MVLHTDKAGESILAKVAIARNIFPESAFVRLVNPKGNVYYQLSFVVAIHFLTALEFKIIVDGVVLGSVVANYL